MKQFIRYSIPVITILAGIFYFYVDPSKTVIVPKCPMKMITGYQCPSCGAQRAIHAFLHGNFYEAVSYNFFFILAIPFLLITIYAVVGRNKANPSNTVVKLYEIVTNRYTLLGYVFAFFAWWIIRNIIGC